MTGSILYYSQSVVITTNQIIEAPNLQVQGQVNVQCTEGIASTQLNCCVQNLYSVQWFGQTALISGKYELKIKAPYCSHPEFGHGCHQLINNTVKCSQLLTRMHNLTASHMASNKVAPVHNKKPLLVWYQTYQPIKWQQQWIFSLVVRNISEMHPHCFLVVFVIYTNWLFISKAFTCSDTQYGKGQEGAISVIGCDPGEEGSMTAVCQSTKWKLISDTCILTIIKQLQTASQVSDQLTVYSRFLLLCRYQLGLLGMLNYFMHHHSNFLCLFVDEY